MVKEELKIDSGQKLLELLDKSDLKPTSFFWFFISESSSWRLIIASPEFEHSDLGSAYKKFIDQFGDNEVVAGIGLSNITLLPNSNGLIKLLQTAIKTSSDSISAIRFTSNTINGVYIDDVYIYRCS